MKIVLLTVTLDVRVGIYNKHTAEKGGKDGR